MRQICVFQDQKPNFFQFRTLFIRFSNGKSLSKNTWLKIFIKNHNEIFFFFTMHF